MAQRLVGLGLQADRALLVDAMERAYNASVCRSDFPHPSGRPEALGRSTTYQGSGKRQFAGDSDGVI